MELFGVAIVVLLVGITLVVLVRSNANRRERRAHGEEARAALEKRASSLYESSPRSQPPAERR